MPRRELARQPGACQIVAERAQTRSCVGFENENSHRFTLAWGENIVVVGGIVEHR
jgi:hypothetical protein